MTDPHTIAARLSDRAKLAMREAEKQDDGEIYVRAYSVPDHLTKSYRVYGLGDPLNRVGLAVRAIIQEQSL